MPPFNEVFCDALSVTYHPDDSCLSDCLPFLESIGFNISYSSDDVVMLHADVNTFARLETKSTFHKVEVKGSALELLRSSGMFSAFLGLLGSCNHTVTRIDAALDVAKDFPSVLHGIRTRFPDGYCRVSRKKGKITELLEPRDSDGKRSGTLYVGSKNGRARKFARIYDKQLESLVKRGELVEPRTRYEFVIREDVTLRDALEPSGLFWHYMGIDLLKRPSDAPEWRKGASYGWHMEKREYLPAERLVRYLDASASLSRMVEIADEIGPNGRSYLLAQLRKKFEGGTTLDSL